MIKYFIIDDEPNAVKNLEKRLRKYADDLECAGTFTDPIEALEALETRRPDLVFLDIEMPHLSGFDWLSRVPDPDFEIIFVTAYDQYAIEAFKHAAVGYIVKPIDPEELDRAIRHARKNIDLRVARRNNKVLLDLLSQKTNRIPIPTQDGYIFVDVESIVRLEGTDGYTRIYCCDGARHMSSYHLGKFRELLEPYPFFMPVHRSHVVNLNRVRKYYNEGYLEMEDGSRVPVSRMKRKELLNRLGGT
ncbi:MAG: response regulator transcription factor [Chlorobi bacterium]|nr:response regulator transcription factor [Chlorobiota bacterium]